ncbi:MAG TPA: hypothetical protein VFQ45_11380 [Longimicrobium sp.]|nr:hypothetical protein [Longimicrobium sp.]
MADERPVAEPEARTGDRRGAERRVADRRNTDRRAPLPWWRKPLALIGGGVLAGTLLAFLLFGGDDVPAAPDDELTTAQPRSAAPAEVEPTPAQPAAVAAEDAYGAAGLERLVLQGEGAVGRVVRSELYCEAPTNIAVTTGTRTEAAVAALVQDGRVPAAECKWGRRDDPRREDFLLLVPPALAGQFASAPVSNDGYVERRRVMAEVEWVGRSEALALRTAGVFRGLVR